MTASESGQKTIQTIASLLDDLPDENLAMVEQFVRFLRQQASGAGQPRYPTVPVPAKLLAGFESILSEGYDGDALEDTEALYDGT